MAEDPSEARKIFKEGLPIQQGPVRPQAEQISSASHFEVAVNPSQCKVRQNVASTSGYLSPSGYSSPRMFGEIKVNLCKPSPEDRLRLIQVLQELDLEQALDVLPDECTLDSLLCLSFEGLKSTLCQCLTTAELDRFWNKLNQISSQIQIPSCGTFRRL